MSTTSRPRILHRFRCPYCRRLRAYLDEKGLEVELVRFDPKRDIDVLRRINPKKQVPTYEDDEVSLFESLVIMEYLEAVHPEPSFVSSDPKVRAKVHLLYDLSDHLLGPAMLGFVRAPFDHPTRPKFNAEIISAATAMLPLLADESPYAIDDDFSLADLSLPPLLFRAVEAGFDATQLPKRIRVWARAILDRPSIATLFPEIEDV